MFKQGLLQCCPFKSVTVLSVRFYQWILYRAFDFTSGYCIERSILPVDTVSSVRFYQWLLYPAFDISSDSKCFEMNLKSNIHFYLYS